MNKNTVCGLETGADDYTINPFEPNKLRADHVDCRVLQLEENWQTVSSAFRIHYSILKRCMGSSLFVYSRKMRNDQNNREEVEEYVIKYSTADFTYSSICPKCYEQYIKPELEKL